MNVSPKTQAWARWFKVSRGELDPETVEWLAGVARGMMAAAYEKDTNTRRLSVCRAAGIVGRAYRNQEFAVAIAEGGAKGKQLQDVVATFTGHIPGTRAALPSDTIRKRVSRALKK